MSSQSLLDERNTRAAHYELLQNMGPGTKISASAYDTAWVARLKDIDQHLSKQALGWLRKNQLPDGSWGAETPLYYHDRVICTLSAILALARTGEVQDANRVQRGTRFLETAFNTLSEDPAGETIAFEPHRSYPFGRHRALRGIYLQSAGACARMVAAARGKAGRHPAKDHKPQLQSGSLL